MTQKVRNEVKKILDTKGFYFPKDVTIKFKTSTGKTKTFTASKVTEFFEKKDVLKIVRLMEE